MEKVAAFYDLISGLLVAIDIVAPSWGNSVGEWLTRRLSSLDDTVNQIRARTLLSNLPLTLLPILILISFVISKSMSPGVSFPWSTVGLFGLGVAIGVIVIFVVSLVALWLRRTYSRRYGTTPYLLHTPLFSSPTSAQEATRLYVIWSFFLVAGTCALLLLRLVTDARVFLVAPILAFVLTVWVFPTAMLWNRSLVRYIAANPQRPHYALARIGLLIFVISKVIYVVIP